jgi:hypothetical protein
MKYAKIFGVFLVMALATVTNAWALGIGMPTELEQSVEFTRCNDEAGSWRCIVKNKTNRVINMGMYYGTSYDRDEVKIDEGNLSGTIEPGGSTKINFSILGYASKVSKIVIRAR